MGSNSEKRQPRPSSGLKTAPRRNVNVTRRRRGRRSTAYARPAAPRRPPGPQTRPLRTASAKPPRGTTNHTPPGPSLPPAAAEERPVTPGIRGRAGPREGGLSSRALEPALLVLDGTRATLLCTPLPVPFKGPRRATVEPESKYKREREGGPVGGVGTSGGRGGGGAKGALRSHVTGTRRSSVGHFRWSAAAPLKRGGGKSGRRCYLFFFSAAGESESARCARVGGEGGRPGRGAGAFAATRAPCLVCLAR